MKSLSIFRRFTTDTNVESSIAWKTTKSEIRGPDGKIIFLAENIEVPAHWAQVATDVLAQKYFRKAGVPLATKPVKEKGVFAEFYRSAPQSKTTFGGETSAKQVFRRLAGAWTYWGIKSGYFKTLESAKAYYDEMYFMLAQQFAAPNSPQWFNTGLHWAYGIDGPSQGHFYSEKIGKNVTTFESSSSFVRPQTSACFINSIQDDLVNEGGIMDLWVREARLFKYGSGAGSNFSNLRGRNERLSGGGRSSGMLSFLKIGDAAAGSIKSGGTTRRAAKMVVVDIDHPDIEEFILWKVREEAKVADLVTGSKQNEARLREVIQAAKQFGVDSEELRAAVVSARESHVPEGYIGRVLGLVKQGVFDIELATFTTDWNSEAYYTVSGQNSNNSISVPNTFMNAVKNGNSWLLFNRVDGQIAESVDARELWNKVGYAAWSSADPGVQFNTTMNEWHTCPAGGSIRATNPCAEYIFLDDTACNLASLNLKKFLNADNKFDVEGFEHAVRLWTITLDISITMAQFPSPEIAKRSFEYRTLGLGYANAGGLLMALGISYDSSKGRGLLAAITSIMTGKAYLTSAEMAEALGSFERYEENKDAMLRVIHNHSQASRELNCYAPVNYRDLSIVPYVAASTNLEFLDFISSRESVSNLWSNALDQGTLNGYRNAQVSVLAPTGCALSTTTIRTHKGVKSYREIMEENNIDWSAVEQTNEKRWFSLKEFFLPSLDGHDDRCDKIWYNGHEETYVITFADGTEFECTSDHKLLVKLGSERVWIEARNLRGDEEVVSYD